MVLQNKAQECKAVGRSGTGKAGSSRTEAGKVLSRQAGRCEGKEGHGKNSHRR